MRKVIFFNMMSVDGYFAGPGGELDWHLVDASFIAFAIEQLQAADGLLFGRKTYELMKNYWPTPMAEQKDRVIADLMNNTPKIVFFATLDKAEWNNTRLVKDNMAAEVSMIKQQPGKDLLLLGSARLASTLIQLNLIDEFRIMISPVILGRGKPLFTGIQNRNQRAREIFYWYIRPAFQHRANEKFAFNFNDIRNLNS